MLFVLNVGRSGSTAVAKWLGLEHEPDRYKPNLKNLRKRELLGSKGETSNFWRLRLPQLMEAYPNAVYLHLIRNGRDVVASYMSKGIYYQEDARPHQRLTLPVPNFDRLSRFEKLCWHWRYWNEYIGEFTDSRLFLEDIAHRIDVVNAGKQKRYVFTDEDEETYQRICGELHEHYGYT